MKLFLFTKLFVFSIIYSQDILKDSYSYQVQNLLYDIGKQWESISCFNTIKIKNNFSESGLLPSHLYNPSSIVGLKNNMESMRVRYSRYSSFNNSFYGYIHSILSIKDNIFEIDASAFGFKNSWVQLHIGRGRENWASGNDIQLALSNKSNPYEYFKLSSDYDRIRVNYIHGFLESTNHGINRYLTARGIEWSNKKNLLIGLSETVIYSGYNRSIDIGYLNPISSHLEIELNERLNFTGNGNANAVWQSHIDYLIRDRIRLSINILFDEFVIDRSIEVGKEHGDAYSIRIAYSPLLSSKNIITLFGSKIKVGTPTFRHYANGTNNFIFGSKPFGWEYGSDGTETNIGINFFNRENIIISIISGILLIGEESIINREFDIHNNDYQKGLFPSGNIEESRFLKTQLQWKIKHNILINCNTDLIFLHKSSKQFKFSLGLDIIY